MDVLKIRRQVDPAMLLTYVKGRAHIDAASYGPDILKVIPRAFDEAWASIAGNFGTSREILSERD